MIATMPPNLRKFRNNARLILGAILLALFSLVVWSWDGILGLLYAGVTDVEFVWYRSELSTRDVGPTDETAPSWVFQNQKTLDDIAVACASEVYKVTAELSPKVTVVHIKRFEWLPIRGFYVDSKPTSTDWFATEIREISKWLFQYQVANKTFPLEKTLLAHCSVLSRITLKLYDVELVSTRDTFRLRLISKKDGRSFFTDETGTIRYSDEGRSGPSSAVWKNADHE